MFALVTTAMQIEALMLLEEHFVLAKHTVPASELWQTLHVPWGAAEQWLSGWISLQRTLGRAT